MKLETYNLDSGFLKPYIENIFIFQTEPEEDGNLLTINVPTNNNLAISIFRNVKIEKKDKVRQYEFHDNDEYHIEIYGKHGVDFTKKYVGKITEIIVVFSPNEIEHLIRPQFIPNSWMPVKQLEQRKFSKECLFYPLFQAQKKEMSEINIIENLIYELSLINVL